MSGRESPNWTLGPYIIQAILLLVAPVSRLATISNNCLCDADQRVLCRHCLQQRFTCPSAASSPEPARRAILSSATSGSQRSSSPAMSSRSSCKLAVWPPSNLAGAYANVHHRRRLPILRNPLSPPDGLPHHRHRPLRAAGLLWLLHGHRNLLPPQTNPRPHDPIAQLLPLEKVHVDSVRRQFPHHGAVGVQGGGVFSRE
jgi:hypothetical protein